MKTMHTVSTPVALDGGMWVVEGDYDPGCPGRYSGPPEHCYPADPAEFYITGVYVEHSSNINIVEHLTESTLEHLTELALAALASRPTACCGPD